MYKVFVRNWWKLNSTWPDGREPDPTAHKRTIAKNVPTEEEARAIAKAHNDIHYHGPLGRKAEYTEQ